MLFKRKSDTEKQNEVSKKPRSPLKLFMTAFLVTTGAILLVGGGAWFAISNTVRPPEIPVIAAVPHIHTQMVSSENDVDEGSDDELLPPQLLQFEERKPMFFTFLIFGLTQGLNANTIMVAAYDAQAGQGYIISIPRDTLVDVQRNSRKIVSAYPVGRLHGGGHEGGVERMKYEVSTLIGFRPDFYVSVDYEAFIRMVNSIGGVEIYVPFRMYYHDPFQDLYIDLQEGLQVLNGEDALRFARYRTGTPGISPTISDYQRIEHQQQVLAAVASQLLTPASILRIPELAGIFNDHVYSDLAMGELLWFANEARGLSGMSGALHLYTLPMLGTSGAPSWYELADEEGILELINRTINPFIRDITAEDLRIVQ